ncbi:chitinase 1 precursor [Purpureocillium lavendulum]|uniref:Chitinase 1 n=1 Tax=Purpureocillium lavendulum TaxID=1247861 RepID=A0AB34FLU2_9HYPO|nr:chitinase 1 precursor [Purpureocillium lavendulum]
MLPNRHFSARWVSTERDEYETKPYFHHKLDHLLHIAGSKGYIGRGLLQIRGNVLRGREENKDVIDVWYLDPDFEIEGIVTNQTLHNFASPFRDTWGDKIWKGPLVITMREGNVPDPRHAKDRDTYGSMVDGIAKEVHLSKLVMSQRAGKTMGWRLNCAMDQTMRGEAAIVPVAVPRMHPLFTIESDDPLAVPEILGFEWVARAYPRSRKEAVEPVALGNKVAHLLLVRIGVQDGKWEGPRSHWADPAIGTILLEQRRRGEVNKEAVLGVCKLIEEVVLPFMTVERAQSLGAEEEVADVVRAEGRKRGLLQSQSQM